jgi:hypothetical protein
LEDDIEKLTGELDNARRRGFLTAAIKEALTPKGTV